MSAVEVRIAIIGDNATRVALIEAGLREAGLNQLHLIGKGEPLLRALVDLAPDVVMVELGETEPARLEAILELVRALRRPVAIFVDRSGAAMTQAAIEAGVAAWIVDGLEKERVKPVLDLAISRFNFHSKLQSELATARNQLVERRLIERAKGILMKERALSEPDAYALLRSRAMNQGRKISEIAQALITAEELLSGSNRH